MTLVDEAQRIVAQGRHAGHSWRTVYAAIERVNASSVNEAAARMRQLREVGIPRWLVQRWAEDAGLAEPRHSS